MLESPAALRTHQKWAGLWSLCKQWADFDQYAFIGRYAWLIIHMLKVSKPAQLLKLFMIGKEGPTTLYKEQQTPQLLPW